MSLHDTPIRKSSKNSSDGFTSQSDLKHVIGEEIGTQAWVAPPDDFIRMISPKKIKDGVDVYRKHWSLEDFICETDSDEFKTACKDAESRFLGGYCGPGTTEWPDSKGEDSYYEPLKNLLNFTSKLCRDICFSTGLGVANIRAIYRADYGTGQPQTTSIYLPNNDDDTCEKWRYEIFTRTAKQPEPRVRMLVVMSSRGKSLLDCDLGKGLVMKFAHAMLGKIIFLE